jgi:2-iminobutanoate/2-iminopropanoate deaminase
MSKKAIDVPGVAKPTNPFSLAIQANGFLYVSGQIGKDKEGKIVPGFTAQVQQALENLRTILIAAGSSLEDVVKVNISVIDISRISELNAVYIGYFNEPYPARATVEVSGLGLNAEVEIEAIALFGG